MRLKDKIAEVAKWQIDTDRKSTAPSYVENLLTDAEIPMNTPSTFQTVSPGTMKLVPLPDRVAQRYMNVRESLLKSKPPFVLLPLREKQSTALPFL